MNRRRLPCVSAWLTTSEHSDVVSLIKGTSMSSELLVLSKLRTSRSVGSVTLIIQQVLELLVMPTADNHTSISVATEIRDALEQFKQDGESWDDTFRREFELNE